jgi:hypothetical protein
VLVYISSWLIYRSENQPLDKTAQKAISRSQNVYLTDADKTAQKAISRSQNVYLMDAK